jgi:hypothetical protein
MHASLSFKSAVVVTALCSAQGWASTGSFERSLPLQPMLEATPARSVPSTPEQKPARPSRSRLFETLKGQTETTQLPDTARREDARGGVFI